VETGHWGLNEKNRSGVRMEHFGMAGRKPYAFLVTIFGAVFSIMKWEKTFFG